MSSSDSDARPPVTTFAELSNLIRRCKMSSSDSDARPPVTTISELIEVLETDHLRVGGNGEETQSEQWLHLQNGMDCIKTYLVAQNVAESDTLYILADVAQQYVTLCQRMAENSAENSDAINSDLLKIKAAIRDETLCPQELKASAESRVDQQQVATTAAAERRAEREIAMEHFQAQLAYQERRDAADRALRLQIARLEFQQRQCCVLC